MCVPINTHLKMRKTSLVIVFAFCGLIAWSQSRIPMLGEQAPSFEANSTNGTFEFPKDFGNSWKILLSHPKDFTPVCTSEILQLAKMQDDEELAAWLRKTLENVFSNIERQEDFTPV